VIAEKNIDEDKVHRSREENSKLILEMIEIRKIQQKANRAEK